VLPEWLPPKIALNGTLQEDYETLHSIYKNEIEFEEIEIEGIPVRHNHLPDPKTPPYTYGFTHLITRDVQGRFGKMRVYNPERAQKLCWVAPLLKNYKDPSVSCFWFETPIGATLGESLAIWLEEGDYILILRWVSISQTEKIVVTAHHVDRTNRKYWQDKKNRSTSRILTF